MRADVAKMPATATGGAINSVAQLPSDHFALAQQGSGLTAVEENVSISTNALKVTLMMGVWYSRLLVNGNNSLYLDFSSFFFRFFQKSTNVVKSAQIGKDHLIARVLRVTLVLPSVITLENKVRGLWKLESVFVDFLTNR